MIQELFGSGSALIGAGERKLISNSNGGIILDGTPATNSSSSPSPLASPNSSSTVTTVLSGSVTKTASASIAGALSATGSNGTNQSSNSSEGQNLRCPRCDSSNTKFCYYNNYNLTQPRHFCKTCRRYWTKGGALRNVPIGGGCRKNKASSVSSAVAKSSSAKFKSLASTGLIGGLDQELPSNPVMWASPHSSHLLALLRGAPISPNPSHSANPGLLIKEEVNTFRANIMADSGMGCAGGMSSHALGLNPLNQLTSIGMCSSFWRNSQEQSALQQDQANHQTYQNGYMLGEGQNDNGIQALYQRLKLSTAGYDTERSPVAATSSLSMATPTSTCSVLESTPSGVGGDQLGYWSNNPNLCWSDLPTSNGAFP